MTGDRSNFKIPTPEPDIVHLLEEEATRINRPEFIANDPVQFPRRFDDLRDIEITSFLAAIIAWGNRPMICRDAERLLALMDNSPYHYVMDEGYEDLDPKMNIHRTMFASHLQWLLRGFRSIYSRYSSLDEFALAHHVAENDGPSWKLIEAMTEEIRKVNVCPVCTPCLPSNLDITALKRVNMALRWLVRDDGIVDMGVWKSIPKSKLFIPLDVHVGNTSRNLGLLSRKSNDRRAVEQLTDVLRSIRPDDPVWFDYALFGIGIRL